MSTIDHLKSARFIAPVLLAAGLLLIVAGAVLPAVDDASAQAADPFEFTLYGGNEVPPIASDATGTVSLEMGDDEMTYHLQASGALFTQAHIHLGSAGTNGPVIAFLLPLQDPPVTEVDISGTITVDDLIGELEGDWGDFATAFLTDNLYVNIHSVAHPMGELRGQADPHYCADLLGENEVPPVDTDGAGVAEVDGSTGGISYSLAAATETDIIAAHIHLGGPDENGDVMAFLLPMGETFGQTVSETGTITGGDLVGPAEGNLLGFIAEVATGNTYVNVHSEDEPDGEIRGQLVHCLNEDAPAPPEVTPTPTATATATTTQPTATATSTPTAGPPTLTPTATNTATATPTNTTVAPAPPDTGTGTGPDATAVQSAVLLALGAALLAAGGMSLAVARRR